LIMWIALQVSCKVKSSLIKSNLEIESRPEMTLGSGKKMKRENQVGVGKKFGLDGLLGY